MSNLSSSPPILERASERTKLKLRELRSPLGGKRGVNQEPARISRDPRYVCSHCTDPMWRLTRLFWNIVLSSQISFISRKYKLLGLALKYPALNAAKLHLIPVVPPLPKHRARRSPTILGDMGPNPLPRPKQNIDIVNAES